MTPTVNKNDAKTEIKELIQRFLKDRETYEKMSEMDIRNKLIDPLFERLGWDINGKVIPDEVLRETSIPKKESTKKKADYTFKIGVTKLVAEAKSLKESLDDENYTEQIIGYAYNIPCHWAVLTNFEIIKIFYVVEDTFSPFYKIDLSDIVNFDENFEMLWFISKQGILDKLLDTEAKKRGIRKERTPIDKQLFNNLREWRDKLSREIRGKYKDWSENDIDETVQRIIDRLIFIRKVEDLDYEERRLEQIVKTSRNMYEDIKKLFFEFNKKYNSKLFGEKETEKALCDKIELSNHVIESVIWQMYRPERRKPEYNFAVIDADVLGNIYEEYLSYILKKTPKGATLKGGISHRKKEGIYYTPSYIVDYIVKNTLGQLLKEKKINPENIKVLDLACGSGSFLLKAFDQLNNWYGIKHGKDVQTSLDSHGLYTRKVRILENNIYGVDLDPKAVEIAQLNLLLKIAQGGERLPTLRHNIRNGNSLIDNEKILKDEAFDWNGNFPDIMNSGGFDVIIGNPPWVFTRGENFTDKEKQYFDRYLTERKILQTKKGKNIQSGKLNLYSLFLVRAIDIMKGGSLLGFIIPNNILRTTTYDIVRRYILDNCRIISIVDLSSGVFEGVTASSIILIFQKEPQQKNRDENEINIVSEVSSLPEGNYKIHKIKQKSFYGNTSFTFNILIDSSTTGLNKKIENNTVFLGKLCNYIIEGIVGSRERDVFDKKLGDNYKPFIVGKDIKR